MPKSVHQWSNQKRLGKNPSYQGTEIKVVLSDASGKKKLKIKDQGMGMSPELIHKINTGQTIESIAGTNQELGNALGLSICYTLAKKNKSSLFVESIKGGGSEFVFSLNWFLVLLDFSPQIHLRG